MRRFLLVIAMAGALILPSCEMVFPNLLLPKPDLKPHDEIGVVPQDFLFTQHAPLNRWLDTPVYVQMIDVPLTRVFDHAALRGLHHRWTVSPRFNPRITVYRVAITRRQLLWSIAQDYKLTLLPVTVPGGYSYIEVRADRS
jgi:hypothetical protein